MDPVLRNTGGIWIGWSGAKDESLSWPRYFVKSTDASPCHYRQMSRSSSMKGIPTRRFGRYFIASLHDCGSIRMRGAHTWKRIDGFAKLLSSSIKPGDRIWVHDYHLMLLPGLLREKLPDAAIGFFLHIPFPASDVFPFCHAATSC